MLFESLAAKKHCYLKQRGCLVIMWHKPEHNIYVGMPLIYFCISKKQVQFWYMNGAHLIRNNECFFGTCKCIEKNPFLLIIVRVLGDEHKHEHNIYAGLSLTYFCISQKQVKFLNIDGADHDQK